ncbi:MAG TPA: DUF2569 family protein, partial [Flavitalea sp.]|nr:DUF2569 family protein [Flavitalea sp.]
GSENLWFAVNQLPPIIGKEKKPFTKSTTVSCLNMFNGYITLMLATQGIMYLLCKQYADHSSLKGTADHIMKELIGLLIYGAVWCTYLARSHRVKGTFLRGYEKKAF